MTAPRPGERVSLVVDGRRTIGTVRVAIAQRVLVVDVDGRRVRRLW